MSRHGTLTSAGGGALVVTVMIGLGPMLPMLLLDDPGPVPAISASRLLLIFCGVLATVVCVVVGGTTVMLRGRGSPSNSTGSLG